MTTRRISPEGHAGIDLRRSDPRLVWASSAKASSEWSSSYAARTACGPPTIYPEGGDRSPAWLAANDDRAPWIELTFPRLEAPRAILICETCGAGAVVSVEDVESSEVLYRATPRLTEPARSARLLIVALGVGARPIRRLRIEVAPYALGSEYKEIDAVALCSVPFEDLAQPYVPPPTREELLTRWRGTLVGVSKERPLVHAIVAMGGATRARSRSDQTQLRLEDGSLLDVEVGETTLYGGRVVRRSGTWREVTRELPILGSLFGDESRPSEAKVRVEVRSIERELDVEIAGEPRTREASGFRDEAGPRTHAIAARAIARGLLVSSAFAEQGLRGFVAMREEIAKPSGAPHPLRAWTIGMWITTALAGALAAWALLAGDAVAVGLSITFAGWHLAHALDLSGAIVAIHPLVARRLDDRRPPFGPYLWRYGTVFLLMIVVAPVVAGLLATLLASPSSPAIALSIVGMVASVLLVPALRAHFPTLRDVLRVTLRPRGHVSPGSWVRVEGHLGDVTLRRAEDYVAKARHLGTDHFTDAQGARQSHDRFETWYERHVTVQTEGALELFLDDGSIVQASTTPRSTDLTLVHVPGGDVRDGHFIARFRGAHGAGEPAALYGRVSRAERGVLVLDDAVLVLDPRRRLARRATLHIASLVLLGGLAVIGLSALVATLIGAG